MLVACVCECVRVCLCVCKGCYFPRLTEPLMSLPARPELCTLREQASGQAVFVISCVGVNILCTHAGWVQLKPSSIEMDSVMLQRFTAAVHKFPHQPKHCGV